MRAPVAVPALALAVAAAGCNAVFGLDPAVTGDGAADAPDDDGPGGDGPAGDGPAGDGPIDAPGIDATDGPPGAGVLGLAAGGAHTCAVRSTGAVQCWGNGARGRLGYGNVFSIGDDEAPASAGAVDVGGAAGAVAAGREHTCAILNNGELICWGANEGGRLGQAHALTIGDDDAPSQYGTIGLGDAAIAVAAGGEHTCAVTPAGVVCWGRATSGQLGYGNVDDIGDTEHPFEVGPIPGMDGAFAVAAGEYHSCALYGFGNVRCWGLGAGGRLGYANAINIGDDEPAANAGDVNLGGLAAHIVAGAGHTCALMNNGTVRCWGLNAQGQLGYGNPNNIGDNETPASAGDVTLGGVAIAIAAGGAHTCALLADGAVRCWGRNDRGQLGYRHTLTIGDNESPSVAGDVPLGGVAIGITAGGDHTCARMADETVRCWGHGLHGRLGLGDQDDVGDDEFPSARPPVEL